MVVQRVATLGQVCPLPMPSYTHNYFSARLGHSRSTRKQVASLSTRRDQIYRNGVKVVFTRPQLELSRPPPPPVHQLQGKYVWKARKSLGFDRSDRMSKNLHVHPRHPRSCNKSEIFPSMQRNLAFPPFALQKYIGTSHCFLH